MIQYNIAAISPKTAQTSIENIDLQKACRLSDLDAIKRACKLHPEKINEKDDSLGWTPLYRTIISGFLRGAEYLLKHKADPNIENNIGETPLHQAADNSQLHLAEILLKNGANPNFQQNDGDTPLHHCAYRGDSKMAEMLLKYKADPNIPNFMFGRTPFHYAADCGHLETISHMIKYQGNAYQKDRQGKTPMDIASQDTAEQIRFLLEAKISLNALEKAPKMIQDNFEPESEISVIKKKHELSPLLEFLQKNDLEEMYEPLCDNGFDDLNDIISQTRSQLPLKKDDLIRIGITKLGLVYKFLMKIEQEAKVMPYDPLYTRESSTTMIQHHSEKSLNDWLDEIKLTELKDIFLDAGFDDAETLMGLMQSRYPITDEFLTEIGVMKLGHRNRILSKLQEDQIAKKEVLVIEKTTNNVSCQKCLIM